MKNAFFIIASVIFCQNALPQSDSVLKFIFVPHPRSENRSQQSVLPAIEKIDFSNYDLTLLGGDLTYYTSLSQVSMDYCDSLFQLDSPNTLWTLGNHDRNNVNLVEEFTGRKSFYAYYRDNITFVVLDTERNASGFQSSFIVGEQLDMLKNICDSISSSGFLVILHHRLLWMIGNSDFSSRIDSVGESTRQLDTTNFYKEIYPLLLQAKEKGVQVICLGGDKSKINIEYSPTDSITFFTSAMAPEFDDSLNSVIIFTCNPESRIISWDFIPLDKVEKSTFNGNSPQHEFKLDTNLDIRQNPVNNEITFQLLPGLIQSEIIEVYKISGIFVHKFTLREGENTSLRLPGGVYIVKEMSALGIKTRKIIVQ